MLEAQDKDVSRDDFWWFLQGYRWPVACFLCPLMGFSVWVHREMQLQNPEAARPAPLPSLALRLSHESWLEEFLMLHMLIKGPLRAFVDSLCTLTWTCRYTYCASYQRTLGYRFTLPYMLCDKPQNSFKHFSFKVRKTWSLLSRGYWRVTARGRGFAISGIDGGGGVGLVGLRPSDTGCLSHRPRTWSLCNLAGST